MAETITRRRLLIGSVLLLPLHVAACGPVPRSRSTASPSAPPIRTGVVTRQGLGAANALRRSRGKSPLQADGVLGRAALAHAKAMARSGRMSHKGFRRRMARAGIKGAAAENVAWGQRSVAEVMDVWEKSSGHRRNMLGPYSRIGIAVATDPASGNRAFWAMVLAR